MAQITVQLLLEYYSPVENLGITSKDSTGYHGDYK